MHTLTMGIGGVVGIGTDKFLTLLHTLTMGIGGVVSTSTNTCLILIVDI